MEWSNEEDRHVVMKLATKSSITARRMDRIAAAKNFLDLQHPAIGRAHFLKGEYAGYFALDLESKTRPARLICEPTGKVEKRGGQYIKESITEFKVIRIEKDYHKK
jgi:hypothetical protein